MKNLKAEAQKLQKKQTHLRKSFQDFLEKWKEATAEELRDENLEYIFLGGWDEGELGYNQLAIQRGVSALIVVDSYHLAHISFEDAIQEDVHRHVNIEKCDMKYLRTALTKFPKAYERYLLDMEKSGNMLDEILKLIP